MSQHIFRTQKRDGQHIVVMMGWDRLLEEYFLAVECVESDNKEQIIYTTLSEDPKNVTIDFMKAVLTKLEINVPVSMYIETQADKHFGGVNRIAVHTETGFTG